MDNNLNTNTNHDQHQRGKRLLLVLLLTSSFLFKQVQGKVMDEQQICTEHDQTCIAKKQGVVLSVDDEEVLNYDDNTVTIPVLHTDDDDDDDDDEYDDDHYDDDDDDDNFIGNDDDDDDMHDGHNDDDEKEEMEEEVEKEDDEEDDEINDFIDYDGDDLCKNQHELCENWAKDGECEANPGYMLTSCPRSCETCESKNNYGLVQSIHEKDQNSKEILEIISVMEAYMEKDVISNPNLTNHVKSQCKNRHVDCALWAQQGECDANPAYMLTNCAPVCSTCHLLDFNTRCPIGDAVDAMKAGDLDKMFERIVGEGNEDPDKKIKYNTTILSRPAYPPGENEGNVNYKIGPWLIIIDEFIKDEECDRLIELGAVEGYERSEDVGKLLFDGSFDSVQSKSRTSYNAWCTNSCYEDPVAQDVMARIETLTGIPEPNSENLQLLKYDVGQFYKVHHDYIYNQEEFPSGPRLLTAFLYLNDVEGGGGTNFSSMDITVSPKKGRILLWPSVLNDNPLKADRRTYHQALPVEKGIKYAANAWIHLRDFKTPNDIGCT